MSTVLRESSETAVRERERLELSAGRSRLSAMLHRAPMRARHLGSEEAARSGLRYQPVAWTVIVLVAVAFYLPGRPEPEAGPAALVPRAATVVSPTTTTTAPTAVTPPSPRAVTPTTSPPAAARCSA